MQAACPAHRKNDLEKLVRLHKGDEEKIRAQISEWWEEPQQPQEAEEAAIELVGVPPEDVIGLRVDEEEDAMVVAVDVGEEETIVKLLPDAVLPIQRSSSNSNQRRRVLRKMSAVPTIASQTLQSLVFRQ